MAASLRLKPHSDPNDRCICAENNELSRELREANSKLQTLQAEKEQLQEELEKAHFALAEKEGGHIHNAALLVSCQIAAIAPL